MANIELVYFGINGRGLLTRLLFKLGDVDFTDTIISFEDFAAMKPALPLGQLPILKIDGEVFCQSNALTGYAAKLAGFPELTAVEELRSCMVIETINEAFEGLVTTAFPAAMAVPDPDNLLFKNAKRCETFYATLRTSAPDQLAKMEKILTHISAEDSVVCGKRSLADIYILATYIMFTDAKLKCDGIKSILPTAVKIAEKLMLDDKIASLVEESQKIQFFPF